MQHVFVTLKLGLLLAATAQNAWTQEASPRAGSTPQRVQMKDGVVWQLQAGQHLPLTNELNLPHSILVKTNGQYRVADGKLRELQEGQVLGADGMLTSPDGSIVPVYDHVVMKNGRPRLFKDGTAAPLTTTLTLGDGTRIQPDGYIVKTDGRRLRLLDGQLFRLDGGTIPTQDSITLRNGKVTVQKDGSLLTVDPGRTLMMNDGTKVFGNGTVIMKDGTTRKLSEGELITVEGVITRR